MTHLWEAKHPYYCNEGNYFASGSADICGRYESWSDFVAEEGDSDPDMNLLFRFDWREADPEEKDWGNKEETLMLFWMGQRKGLYRWSEIIVSKDDEPAIRVWLQDRFDYIKRLWSPLDGSMTPVMPDKSA